GRGQEHGAGAAADGAHPRSDALQRPTVLDRVLGPLDALRQRQLVARGGVRHGQWADTYWMIMLSVIHSIGALSSVSGLLDGPIGRRWRASAAAGSSG